MMVLAEGDGAQHERDGRDIRRNGSGGEEQQHLAEEAEIWAWVRGLMPPA
jgi:hypothetical protein